MDLIDRAGTYWWHLLVAAHAVAFLIGIALWMTGSEPLGVLFILVAVLLPLSIVAVLLDGQ